MKIIRCMRQHASVPKPSSANNNARPVPGNIKKHQAMTHNNRGRLTVDASGNWQLYTNTIPANATPIGTVTRDIGDTGALVRIETTGAYVQVNAGAIRSLDGRKVAAALGTAGRPAEMAGGKRSNIYLDAASREISERIGNGNISEGIRLALASYRAD